MRAAAIPYTDLAGYRTWARRWVRRHLAVRWSTVRWVLRSWRSVWRSCRPAVHALGSALLNVRPTTLTKSLTPLWSSIWSAIDPPSKDDTSHRQWLSVGLAVMLALIDVSLLGWDICKAHDFLAE